MSVTAPVSGDPISALIWELGVSTAAFGSSPLGQESASVTGIAATGGTLAPAVARARRQVTRAIGQLSTSTVTIVRSTPIYDQSDPFGQTNAETVEQVKAYVTGPSAEALENGFLSAGDYEVLIAANSLETSLTENDRIRIGGNDFAIVGIRNYPTYPDPIACKYYCKRVA